MPLKHSLSNLTIPADFDERLFAHRRSRSSDHWTMHDYPSPTATHSRDPSNDSNVSSTFASVFSTRLHSRWPSSTSSLATSPDSPAMLGKSALHDLLEDPSERDDEQHAPIEEEEEDDAFKDFCLCDLGHCEHQRNKSTPHTPNDASSLESSAYVFGGAEDEFTTAAKRRSSAGSAKDDTSSRLCSRLPSISRQWRNRKSSRSISSSAIQSPVPSRSSSLRKLRRKQSSVSQFRSSRPDITTRHSDGFEHYPEPDILDDQFFWNLAKESLHDSAHSSSAMLPSQGSVTSHPVQTYDSAHSMGFLPLTEPIRPQSVFSSPMSSPTSPAMWSQPLSTKPSLASMRTSPSRHGGGGGSGAFDIPPFSLSDPEFDIWSLKLGHSNFHIHPEPYLPDIYTPETCKRLLEDWETARVAFMRHAAQTVECHGPSSKTYKLTGEKWDAIDSHWRANFEHVRACAEEASGEELAPALRALPETQTAVPLPFLSDPRNPDKFPVVDEASIVGPMVRYDAPQQPQQQQQQHQEAPSPKRTSFLKLLTDAASLLRKSS